MTRLDNAEAPVRLGVLGCADIAWRRTLPAVAATRSVELVAVASRDPDKADRFARRFDCEAVTGYARLLDRDDIDAVYLPLPVGLRHEWITSALLSGRHVLSEKPLTTGYASATELVALAERHGLVLAENFTFPHHSQHREVRALLAAGAIGRVHAFMSEFGVPAREPDDIRNDLKLGGSALLDVGVYPLRAAQYFFGPDLRVEGAALRYDEHTGVDLGGSVLLAAPDGATAQLAFGFGMHYRNTYDHWGAQGALRLDRAFTPPETLAPVLEIQGPDGAGERVLKADHQFRNTLDAFAADVRGVGPRRHDPADTLALARLLDDVRECVRDPR
ncbi:Gfo/Idh/MocA family protein [Nocardiopsis ansamitocini]|uniref:Oxidoreductase n=1 Tax=Nocardiopsis ansamitocini TaxID=1670832 RepID=A0A9W6ULA3_9ACTN|nr:Gfo/Idh/MocA family oxidoreductase [Nocardiopsis ansamitocini]GLU50507.1 oxidoreductase [Nocardiopsis ansamitocini]